MSTVEKAGVKPDRNPPYIPWKTLENYIGTLKASTVPHTLDGSVKPRGMAGGAWRQLLSAFRFLGLTLDGNVVSDGLQSLVDAHGTDQWGAAVKEFVLPPYDEIVGDLPLENATPQQLNRSFSGGSGASGQVLDKCIRFYLHALKLSGMKYSSHLSMREPGSSPKANGSGKKKPRQKPSGKEQKPSEEGKHDSPSVRPPGVIDFPIPIGSVPCYIRVPLSITMDQFPMVQAMVNGVEALAKQNGAK